MSPFSFFPNFFNNLRTQGISFLFPTLDTVVRIADPSTIPETSWLRQLVEVVVIPASMVILLFALCCALIQQQRLATVGASNFSQILYRLLFHVAILAAYPFLFGWVVEATQSLGDLFLTDDQISAFTLEMYQHFKGWDFGSVVVGIVATITYLFAFVLFFVFFLARYMILALYFVVGPVVVAFSVWEMTSRFRSWLTGLIQVASWVVVLKFIIAVSLSFSLDKIYNTNQTNIIYVIAANILYVVMIWHTPAIASTLIGGASLGFLGTQVIGFASHKTMEAMSYMDNFSRNKGRNHGSGDGGNGHSNTGGQASSAPVSTLSKDPYGAGHRGKISSQGGSNAFPKKQK